MLSIYHMALKGLIVWNFKPKGFKSFLELRPRAIKALPLSLNGL